MSRFQVRSTPLAGLCVVKRERHEDERGFFSRVFCAEDLMALGWTNPVMQINHTLTREQGTLRGMHFQHPPHAETKLVSCLQGEVWDVAIDLRADSPTFLRWHAERLSAENDCALLIPRGFAHGFQTLAPNCELLYIHDAFYSTASEGGIHPLDPRVDIEWPLPVSVLSERDRTRPMLTKIFGGISA